MDWIYSIDDPLLVTVGGSILMFLIIILLTRIIGLRSFAKFTAYDFAVTIAIGSIVGAILTSTTSVSQGFVAIASLLSLTYIFSWLQRQFPLFKAVISNKPLLLMQGSEILNDNLQHARIDKSQLIAKLREANVTDFDQILAVVLESTGDISVLHKTSSSSQNELSSNLIEDVKRTP